MPKHVDPEKKAAIFKLREDGWSFRQIEKEIGISKSSLSYWFSKGQKEKTLKRGRKYRDSMSKFINSYKEERGCQDCRKEGYPGMHPYYVLDADHVRGEKTNEISKMAKTSSKEEIIEELAKCDIVCANHHRTRTHNRRILRKEVEAGRE
jgi:hypothetical protein